MWTLALTQTVGYGVLYYAFGVLVRPMEAEFGFTRAQTGGAFSLGLLVAGLSAIPIGRLVDRSGARWIMTGGAVVGVIGMLLWSRVTGLPGLYAVWVLLGLAMGAVLYEVAFTVVAMWFRQQRARAIFWITLVAGLASTLFTPLTTVLVSQFGWRGAALLLSVALAVLVVPLHAVVLRHRPQDLGLHVDGDAAGVSAQAERHITVRAAVRSASFWRLAVAFALARFGFAAMGAHLVPLLSERSLASATVAAVVGAVGPLQLVGRIAFLPLHTRLPNAQLTALLFAALGAAFLALVWLPGWWGLGTFVLLYGSSNGATTLTRATLTAELFGAGSYGSINGAVTLVVAIMSAFAPLLMGAIHDWGVGYQPVLWTLLMTSGMATICIAGVRGIDQTKASKP